MEFKPSITMIPYKGIQINGQFYTSETIVKFCAGETPEFWKVSIVNFLTEWFNSNFYIEVHTSGSTGTPKMIRLSKKSMEHSAHLTNAFFHITGNSQVMLCLPTDYIAGKMMLVRALVSGCMLIAVPPSGNPFEMLKHNIDFVAVTPYQLQQSLSTLKERTVKRLIVGGGAVSYILQTTIINLETEVYETYGMTETCSHIALRRLNGDEATDYFRTLPGINIRQDDRNCLVINAPDLNDQEIITNDVVEVIGGDQFRWLGRFDHVINSGGIKLHPEQIEKKLEGMFSTRFFISSIPDPKLGNIVILVIEGQYKNEGEVSDIKQNLSVLLTKYEVPKYIYFVRTFVTSSSGKILKGETLNLITG
jgi:o-succinylbenzoate---CoA ligase